MGFPPTGGGFCKEPEHTRRIFSALLQFTDEGARRCLPGPAGLSCRVTFELFADKLDRLGQSRGAEAKSALDEAGLTLSVTRNVEGRGLPFAERAHHLEALDGRVGRLERLEAPDRSDQLLQLAVVSLDDVVEILDLSVLRLLRTPALLF